MPLSSILYDLQKMFDISSKQEIYSHACESGVWINVRLKYNGKDYGVSGSRMDIVQKRLIEWIDRQRIRDDFI